MLYCTASSTQQSLGRYHVTLPSKRPYLIKLKLKVKSERCASLTLEKFQIHTPSQTLNSPTPLYLITLRWSTPTEELDTAENIDLPKSTDLVLKPESDSKIRKGLQKALPPR